MRGGTTTLGAGGDVAVAAATPVPVARGVDTGAAGVGVDAAVGVDAGVVTAGAVAAAVAAAG